MQIVIGLLSCPKHNDRDILCRSTWIPKATQLGIQVVFLRGGASAFRQDGDTLYFPMIDHKDRLPPRTRAFCHWAIANTDADVFFKADNDSYIVPERLIAFAESVKNKDLWGNEPGGRWRGYCSGGAGYGLSRSAATILAEYLTAPTGAEDQLATRTLQKYGIQPYFPAPRRFVSWGIDADDRRPSPTNGIITTHQIPFDLWMKIHQEMYG